MLRTLSSRPGGLTLRRAYLLVTAALVAGCHAREAPEAARDRAAEQFLIAQIADLGRLAARAEQGDLVTRDRIAIGVSEQVVKQLLDAGLPREAVLGGKVRVRVETAQPFFRGNNAAMYFQATARSVAMESAGARLELGGSLERVRITEGRLVADVQLNYWNVLDTSLGGLGAGVLDGLIRQNLATIASELPNMEIPVQLGRSVQVDGLSEGAVTTQPGVLPLEITVAEVVPVRQRLWVFLDAHVGPWHALPASEAGE